MVFKHQAMDEDDDLEALRLAALQTIRPRAPREKAGISSSKNQTDTAAFFRPVSNPNLIAIVPLDSENKKSTKEIKKLVTVPVPKYEEKKSVKPAEFGSDAKEPQTEKVETKFSRFRDSESDSEDESIDGNVSFRNDRNIENTKQQSAIQSDDDCLNLRDDDDDSLEKLMDQMEKEFNGTESGIQKVQISKSKVDRTDNLILSDGRKERETQSSIKDPKVSDLNPRVDDKRISSSPSRNLPPRKKSPNRSSPKIYSETSLKDNYKRNRSPVHSVKRSPYRSRSPIRSKSRSPRRYGRRSSASPRRRSVTPRRKRSLSRSLSPSGRVDRSSPKRRFRSSKRRSVSPWKKSPSQRRRSFSPRRKSISPRKKSASPKRGSVSPRRRSFSPRTKSPSPRRRGYSPRRKSISPRQRKVSPSHTNGSNSPKRPTQSNNYSSYSANSPVYSSRSPVYNSRSPMYPESPLHGRSYEGSVYHTNPPSNSLVLNNLSSYESNSIKYAQSRKRSSSQGRKSFSPVRKLNSPKHRRKSPRKSISPREFSSSKKRSRSPRSPNRRSASPKQHKAMSPRRKLSPVRRRSASPRRISRKSPLRGQAWSPPRIRPSPEGKSRSRKVSDVPKRSPINSSEPRGKERNDRSVKITKPAKGNNENKRQIEENKNDKEQKRKEEKKVPESVKPEGPPNPVLEARRKKFESNSLVAPTNKKIRLGPVINRVVNEESNTNDAKSKDVPAIKTFNSQVKNVSQESENENQGIDFSADILLLDTDYNLDELDEAKETAHILEPPLEKTRKLEVQTSVPAKRQLKKRTVNEEPLVVQKRKISVNIKPTALKALEEKSKKISEHKMIQENKDTPTKKNIAEKSSVSCKNPENSTNKRVSHRQVKNSKEVVVENKEERSESTSDNKGIDLRTELCRRRAERLKGGPKLVPITRLLQSAFDGVVGNKAVRTNRTTSPEAAVTSVKKKNVPAAKARRVQVVQMKRLDRVLESGSQESDSDEGIRDIQRNSCSHLNSQSGRSVLHRNQV